MRRKVENLFTGEFFKSVFRGLNIMKPQKLPISILFEILEGDTRENNKKGFFVHKSRE
jgi:hypothetical protein